MRLINMSTLVAYLVSSKSEDSVIQLMPKKTFLSQEFHTAYIDAFGLPFEHEDSRHKKLTQVRGAEGSGGYIIDLPVIR